MINSFRKKKTDDVLRLETARTLDEIDKYAEAWDLLALQAPQQHPTLTHAWISAYLKSCVKKKESWFCLFAFDKNDLVGVLPLLARERRYLGNKYLLLRTPNDPHTMAVDFLFKEKYGNSVIKLFIGYLNNIHPRVIRLTMVQMQWNSPTFGVLEEGISGIYSFSYQNGHVSIIPVEGNFDDYKKKLSKKIIEVVRRSGNKLHRLGNFSITITTNESDARENLLSLANLEQSGWKGKEGTAIKDKFWKFFELLVHNLDNEGWLKWYFLNIDGKKIAGWLSIPFGRSVVALKTGYNEEYRSCSPGSILTEKMIEDIFLTGKFNDINFLTDFGWYSLWKMERKPYYITVFAFNNLPSFFKTRIPFAIYSKFPLLRRLKTILSRFI